MAVEEYGADEERATIMDNAPDNEAEGVTVRSTP